MKIRVSVNPVSRQSRKNARRRRTITGKSLGEFVIVERGKPRLIVMRCPCGCGDHLFINVDERLEKHGVTIGINTA